MSEATTQQKRPLVPPQRIAFSKTRIERLPTPKAARQYYYDQDTPGLAVCVTPAGTKTFYFNRKVHGKPTRTRVGRFPAVSVEQARGVAKKLAGKVAEGIDPQALKWAQKDAPTLQELFEHWLAHAKLYKRTWKSDERQFQKYFKTFQNRRLRDITTAEVAKWHSAIGRDRFLQADELEPFFAALKEEPPLWRDFWLLCLFSGARRGNVAGMAWRDIDLNQGVWYLPGQKTKAGLPLAIVLPPPAVAILKTRQADAKDNAWVFPTDTPSGHVVHPQGSWARVVKRAGIQNLRPHDLRRSLGSWQAIAGASLTIIGASLGHRDPKATAVYARLQLDPIRSSVNQAVDAMVQAGKLTLDAPQQLEGSVDDGLQG